MRIKPLIPVSDGLAYVAPALVWALAWGLMLMAYDRISAHLKRAVITSEDARFVEHDTGPGHPERADRMRAVTQALERKEFSFLLREEAPLREDVEEMIALAHPKAYIAALKDARPAAGEQGQWHAEQDGDGGEEDHQGDQAKAQRHIQAAPVTSDQRQEKSWCDHGCFIRFQW